MPIRLAMDIPPALLQFLGSLSAILMLAWIARLLRLGPAPRLADDAEARRIADEAVGGYAPVAIALDGAGRGALMRDAAGRLLLLRPHGTHFVGRILSTGASTRREGEVLVVETGERHFGETRMVLSDPESWARAVSAAGAHGHA